MIRQFCHDCANFSPIPLEEPLNSKRSACSLGHEMKFAMPIGHPDIDRDWGLHRDGCRDRVDAFSPWKAGEPRCCTFKMEPREYGFFCLECGRARAPSGKTISGGKS